MVKNFKAFFLFIVFISLGALTGCDMIQSAFQTPGKTTTSRNLAPGGGETNVPPGTVLAKINNDVITLESFDEKIKNLQMLSPDIKINTPDAKKAYLNDLVTQELIFQEARARGIDRKKDVKDALDEFKKSVMARQLILDETKGLTVESSEVEAFYNQYKKEFAAPEEIHAREIVVPTEAAAKDILISLLQGGDFAAAAKEKSVSPSASKGGDLGIVKKGEPFAKFYDVVSTLEAGQVSQIFNGPNGFYIAKVEEKKGGAIPQLTDKMPNSDLTVYDQIKNGLLQQKQAQRIQDLTDKLKREAKIEIKADLLR